MPAQTELTRRSLLKTGAAAVAACTAPMVRAAKAETAAGQRIPLKIGIRAASMRMVGDLDVVKMAAGIPGLMGVELQAASGKKNLRQWDVVLQYKKEADRWGMHIPSLAGVFDPGVKIHSPGAGESLAQTIRAAELLGSRVLLVAFFKADAPDMTREESYGPIVSLLQKTAGRAADAGVVLGLENSLSPADNKKLVDLVGHPAVGVYYDLHNMAFYGHAEQAIPGVKLLGKQRICMVHVKNGNDLLEQPGPIDWAAALGALSDIQYEGWCVYETGHRSISECIEDTKKNNLFLRKHVQMPLASGLESHVPRT